SEADVVVELGRHLDARAEQIVKGVYILGDSQTPQARGLRNERAARRHASARTGAGPRRRTRARSASRASCSADGSRATGEWSAIVKFRTQRAVVARFLRAGSRSIMDGFSRIRSSP